MQIIFYLQLHLMRQVVQIKICLQKKKKCSAWNRKYYQLLNGRERDDFANECCTIKLVAKKIHSIGIVKMNDNCNHLQRPPCLISNKNLTRVAYIE